MLLNDLNDYVLTLIFEKCTIDDAITLYYVCKRFRAIVNRYTFLKKSLDLLLVGHRNHDAIAYQRTLNDLSYYQRIKLFNNWCHGRYEEHIFFHQKRFNPAQIFLEKEYLYITHGGQLRIHKRTKKDLLRRKPERLIGKASEEDITCFIKKDDTIFAGRTNGRILIISTDTDSYVDEQIDSTPNNRIDFLDFDKDLFITTTRASTKLWRKMYELDIPYLDPVKEWTSGNKCLRLSPDIRSCAVGKYSEKSKTAMRLIDLETSSETILNSVTYSIYDILWKDNHTILTGNYDTTLRLFDRRTNCDQLIWTDPYDLAVYCMSFDGNFGVLCGMKYHCRVNLYDLRVPNKYIQLYFPNMHYPGSSGSSPAYSVANDQSQLFIATDHNLRVFDFDADWAQSKDYTNIFVHEMIAYV